MINMDLQTIENTFQTATSLIASDSGKRLSVEVRFDGYGNSVVRFVIQHEGKRITFEKFDAAATRYNMMK